jgi:hypothetical protein
LEEALLSKMYFLRTSKSENDSPLPLSVLGHSQPSTTSATLACFASEYEQRLHERLAVFAALRSRFARAKEKLAQALPPSKVRRGDRVLVVAVMDAVFLSCVLLPVLRRRAVASAAMCR